MLAADRYTKILQILSSEGSVRNIELSKSLNVSVETVRRDLDYLEKEGLLKKVHGGATTCPEKFETSYMSRSTEHVAQKLELAENALKFIEDGDTIALNSGTTNIQIARLIREKKKKITLITNSLLIANEVCNADNIDLIFAGGIFSKKEFAFFGRVTANFISQFSVSKCFLSVGGISLEKGVSDYYEEEVIVEQELINISKEVIVVADSSKFENNSLFKIADLSRVSVILTDSELDEAIKTKYIENNIKLINL